MAEGKSTTGRQVSREPVSSERVVELVSSRRHESIQYNSRYFTTLQGRYDTFRGTVQGNRSQFRNNMSIPFTFAMIQTWVARMAQTAFGTWPIVEFEGYAPEDEAKAKKNKILVSAQMKDAESFVRSVDFFLQDAICGTAICRYGWKNLTRRHRVRSKEEVAPGFSIPVIREYDAEIFNGPTWDVIDRLDFWQQPARKRISDMAWVIHRYWLDWDDMMEDSQGEYPYFDPSAVRMLKEYPMKEAQATEYQQRKLTFRNEYDYMARQREQFAKPVEIWEMHGLVPSEFTKDGIRARCIAIGNGRVVLKNRPSPMPDQSKPFIAYSSMPDPYGFDGIAKAEIASKPQRIADRLANQKLDALDLLIDPMWVMDSKVNFNSQSLFTRAGRVFLSDHGVGEDVMKPLTPDMRGFQAAYPEITTLYQYMQLGLGINDILLGQQGGGRETARGYLGRQENTLSRVTMEQMLAEQQFIEPLANAFRKLDREFLTLPHEIKILGSVATTNPVTGLPYEAETATIDYDDLAPDYRARAVGASQIMGRAQKQQNLIQLLQILGTNPAMMQLVNWSNFARQAFELFEFRNINELLVTQVPMINKIAMENGRSPESVAGMASTPLEQLSPDVLGQFMNVQNPSPLGV